ncbi:hypothetical protein GQ55_9G268200 [Panicum hallii var. hallii]|uniref:Uncharacterized protein n=1 Tax=Panicum hallii var. hallii TaxID=1504633 RepID=A0A2T7C7B1_9POAL|nr:hypothetical protein GQ55_9G268200 [Panicum hallii var. hallii]
MKAEEVIETRNHMFNLFLAVSPEIFLINATFILLIHGVVFSTSKKDDYPPLVSNGNLHVWFWPGFPSVSNNLASARRWRTSPNYCPFILE